MTLQDLIAKLNELAISNPQLLTEQVSILEPDLEDESCLYEIESIFVNNDMVSLLMVI